MSELFSDLGRVLLVTNTASGMNVRCGDGAISDVASAVGLRHRRIDDIGVLNSIVQESSDQGVRLIVVNGGDGTVRRILDIFRATGRDSGEPTLAVLYGGTTNLVAQDVGWPGRPHIGLCALLSALNSGRHACIERHVLRARQSRHNGVHHGFFFATHAAVRAVRLTRARFHQLGFTGRLSEIVSIAALIGRLCRRRIDRDPVLSPVRLTLSRDGGEWRGVDHILLFAISTRPAVLGVRALPRGQPAGLEQFNRHEYRLLPWLYRMLRGRMEALGTLSLRGEFEWMMDGEIYRHRASDGSLTIDVARPVRFLTTRPDP